MTRSTIVTIGMATIGLLVVCWQFEQHRRTARELAAIETEARAQNEKIQSRQETLASLQQRNTQLLETEGQAGNRTLASLVRERAAAEAVARSNSAAAEKRSVRGATAQVLENAGQQEIEREALRARTRANMGLFFKLVELSPEKMNQYIDLEAEKESRKSRRTADLLRGNKTLEDALRERDSDKQELESQQRALLEEKGAAFLDSIADGMRNDEAKRLANSIQQAMGDNTMSDQQREKLQGLIKAEIVAVPLDDTDLFRTPDDWAQIVSEHQQNVVRAASGFLSQAQITILQKLVAFDLAAKKQQMIQRRQSLGIK